MDFLVVGLGLGALAILSGISLVTLGVWRAQRAARRASLSEEQRYFAACAGGRDAAGQALIAAGAVMLLATIGAVAGSLDDRTGSLLVATTATVAAIGLIARDFLFRARNPMPRRPRARPLEAPVAASPTRTAPLAMSPITATQAQRSASDDETPEAPDEVVAAMVEEPALDAQPEHDLGAAAGTDVAVPEAVPDREPADGEADPVAETGAVIDMPYSFMRDDDAAGRERTVPYSFMAADNLQEASKGAASRNGAEPDRDDEAALEANELEHVNDSSGGGTPRATRPSIRLMGKQRARTP